MNDGTSGIFESLRAKCGTCGNAIAKHPYCEGCGRPRRCGEEAGWTEDERGERRCPSCLQAANF
jgi:hypothetical protein